MKKIKVLNVFLLVDDEDYKRLLDSDIYYNPAENVLYVRTLNGAISIARFILNYTGKLEVDHKDRNRLNNQKSNFRFATHSQNTINQGLRLDNTSGYKGVLWNIQKQKWIAKIKGIYLGCFNSKEEAAKAYNKKAFELYGEFAYLNIIKDKND